MSSIPVHDADKFDEWLRARWAEKDELLEYFGKHNEFPGDPEAIAPPEESAPSVKGKKITSIDDGVISTMVKPNYSLEFLQIFVSILAVPLVWKAGKWIFWILSFFVRIF
jgi:lysocardiolipin and lysophospholipid acyltransferase